MRWIGIKSIDTKYYYNVRQWRVSFLCRFFWVAHCFYFANNNNLKNGDFRNIATKNKTDQWENKTQPTYIDHLTVKPIAISWSTRFEYHWFRAMEKKITTRARTNFNYMAMITYGYQMIADWLVLLLLLMLLVKGVLCSARQKNTIDKTCLLHPIVWFSACYM